MGEIPHMEAPLFVLMLLNMGLMEEKTFLWKLTCNKTNKKCIIWLQRFLTLIFFNDTWKPVLKYFNNRFITCRIKLYVLSMLWILGFIFIRVQIYPKHVIHFMNPLFNLFKYRFILSTLSQNKWGPGIGLWSVYKWQG